MALLQWFFLLVCLRLIELFPDWQLDEVPVHIAWPENRHLPAKTRVFIDWIRTIWAFQRCQKSDTLRMMDVIHQSVLSVVMCHSPLLTQSGR